MGRKKQAKAAKTAATIAESSARRAAKEARRSAKKEHRKRDRKIYTADQWAIPAPRHLIAKLDAPKHKSKYQSYFEFAENTEKKEKKLEFKVTNDSRPPPGFVFVPIGDPTLTTACKELSRERDAMIFIVSNSKEENSKISEHIYRTGYHFREVIVEDTRRLVGEAYVPKAAGLIEPIPESQEEINKQADAAIRDLFPRIPNTDRQMIVEHAFQKGALFHGEPTVGLQTNIPLSRRVQLAVLAHIRHTHTRYDKLLRETSWMNARKAVEPVCLDVLVKWRGDEETGRDQMDEILREVVIITDSEDDDDSSDTDDSSAEEGEVSSTSSSAVPSQPISRAQPQAHVNNHPPVSTLPQPRIREESANGAIPRPVQLSYPDSKPRNKKAQRGFRRYQTAWEDALHRRQDPRYHDATAAEHRSPHVGDDLGRKPQGVASPFSQPTHSLLRRSPHLNSPVHPNFPDSASRTMRPEFRCLPRQPDPAFSAHNGNTLVRPSDDHRYHEPPAGLAPYSSLDSRLLHLGKGHATTQGLQDLLVPSIEPTSSECVASSHMNVLSSHLREWHEAGYRQVQPPSVIEHSGRSPVRRQVIIIDDDSLQNKRRRVGPENASGSVIRVPIREQDGRRTFTHAEPHGTAASFSQHNNNEFRPLHTPPQMPQGLSRELEYRERIPAYTRPLSGGYAELPDQMRRTNLNFGKMQEEERHKAWRLVPIPQRDGLVEPVHYSSVKMAEDADSRDRRALDSNFRANDLAQRLVGSTSTFSAGISPMYNRDSGPAVADQPYVHRFSESRFQPSLPQTRDGFITVPERSGQDTREGAVRYGSENQPARPLASLHPVQARSPGRFADRGFVQYPEEVRRPIFYELRDPHRPVYSDEVERQHPAVLDQSRYLPRQDVQDGGRDPIRQNFVLD